MSVPRTWHMANGTGNQLMGGCRGMLPQHPKNQRVPMCLHTECSAVVFDSEVTVFNEQELHPNHLPR